MVGVLLYCIVSGVQTVIMMPHHGGIAADYRIQVWSELRICVCFDLFWVYLTNKKLCGHVSPASPQFSYFISYWHFTLLDISRFRFFSRVGKFVYLINTWLSHKSVRMWWHAAWISGLTWMYGCMCKIIVNIVMIDISNKSTLILH